MFALKPFLALTALALAALAIPAPQDGESSQCDPDSIYCCDATSAGNSTYMRSVGSALKMDLVDDKMYATGCSSANPVNVGGGVSCSSIPVCCEDNYFGLIGVGCASIPVSV